jgi:hypothetical protein
MDTVVQWTLLLLITHLLAAGLGFAIARAITQQDPAPVAAVEEEREMLLPFGSYAVIICRNGDQLLRPLSAAELARKKRRLGLSTGKLT